MAVAPHTTWDSIGGVIGYAVLAVISLGLLTGFARRLPHRAGRRDAAPA